MTKAWWLGFPRFHCPHCGKLIDGLKFVGKFKLPRVRRESGSPSANNRSSEGEQPLASRVSATAAKRTRKPRRDVERGVTGL